MNYKETYNLWLQNVTDKRMLTELKMMKGSQIEEAFTGELSFGTAGLRGVMAPGSNRMNVYTVYKATEGLAQYMLAHGMRKCAITYDSRINSRLFSEIAAATLARHGISVVITKECMPTPFLSFMVRELGCGTGINVTASHNPSEYNGYKVYDNKGCQLLDDAAEEVTGYIEKVDIFAEALPKFNEYLNSFITYVDPSVEDKYVKSVLAEGLDKVNDLTVVYTPLNGAGYRIVPKVLAEIGVEEMYVVAEQSKPDGNFTTCPYPNPEKNETLSLALKLANEKNADIIIANDPDCDRLGVAAKDGDGYRRLTGNEVGVLLADYVLNGLINEDKLPNNPVIVKTIVSTNMTNAVAQAYGVKVREVLTGFKYIGDVISQLEQRGKRKDYVFGFEESCGYLKGSYVRDKDGVVAAMLVAQCASYYKSRGTTIVGRLEQLYAEYGYYQESTLSYKFEGIEGEEIKNKLLADLRKKPFQTLGESKVVDTCDFLTQQQYDLPPADVLRYRSEDGSQLIVRPSGTEPLIKCYVSVNGDKDENAKKFDAIKAQADGIFEKAKKKTNKGVKPPIFTTLNTVTCAMLCALAVIMATTFHAILPSHDLANLFAPMHFPILLIGMLCGPVYGFIGGIVTPLISFLMGGGKNFDVTSMVPMMVELSMYGLISGLLRKPFLKNPKTNKCFSTLALVVAMVVGRGIHAVVKAAFLTVGTENAFLPMLWARFLHDFATTWAGIAAQLILIPAILYALLGAGILIKYIPDLPERNARSTKEKPERKAKKHR